jgi:hypothetical protein
MRHVRGYPGSPWTPPLGNYLLRIAPAARATANDYLKEVQNIAIIWHCVCVSPHTSKFALLVLALPLQVRRFSLGTFIFCGLFLVLFKISTVPNKVAIFQYWYWVMHVPIFTLSCIDTGT